MRFKLIFLAILIALAGCSWISQMTKVDTAQLRGVDVRKLHPMGKYHLRFIKFSESDRNVIRKTYGEEYLSEANQVPYYVVRPFRGHGRRGNVFQINNETLFGTYRIIVCTTGGRVKEIYVKNSLMSEGKAIIGNEFLKQFIGKSLDDCFEIAEKPDDLHTIPTKVKPIRGYPEISRQIATDVKKVLIWARIFKIS